MLPLPLIAKDVPHFLCGVSRTWVSPVSGEGSCAVVRVFVPASSVKLVGLIKWLIKILDRLDIINFPIFDRSFADNLQWLITQIQVLVSYR